MARLEAVQAIGAQHAEILRQKAGITSVSSLLKVGGKPDGRRWLSDVTGIDLELIQSWVNLADMLRVKGVGVEYAHLLTEVGIAAIYQLQEETPDNLYQNLQVVNTSRRMVRRLPTVEMIADWIEQAKELPPSVEP